MRKLIKVIQPETPFRKAQRIELENRRACNAIGRNYYLEAENKSLRVLARVNVYDEVKQELHFFGGGWYELEKMLTKLMSAVGEDLFFNVSNKLQGIEVKR